MPPVAASLAEELGAVGEAFGLPGPLERAGRLGGGHIHATFEARYAGPAPAHCVHQRLNTTIFSDPEGLMENLARVSAHLRAKLVAAGVGDPERRVLTPLRTPSGALLHRDPGGGVWRSFPYVEGVRSAQRLEGPAQAVAVGRAFGRFAALLADLPAPPLRPTLPRFHDFALRREGLESAARRDPCGRAAACAAETAALLAHAERLERRLAERGFAALPRRVVHHDCKLDNLLLDAESGEPVCVVDLDTVMAGTLLSDFGELVRTGICPSPEDEPRPETMRLDLGLFEGLARGYLDGLGPLLTAEEREALPLAGPLLTLMNALRFHTDHLEGDRYFRLERPGHNRTRARAQQHLAELMLGAEEALGQALERAARSRS